MTLTEFLLARIAEDEALAHAASGGPWKRDSGWSLTAAAPEDWQGPYVVVETKQRNDAEFIEAHAPARVLAQCEADRRIVAFHRPSTDHDARFNPYCVGCWEEGGEDGAPTYPCRTVRFLALPFADHPDYRPEWKP